MDVILDANAFLSDIRFQNVPFQSLLAYLKRLKHTIIIPEVVFQEVLGTAQRQTCRGARQREEQMGKSP